MIYQFVVGNYFPCVYPILCDFIRCTCSHIIDWLLLAKVPGHVVRQGVRTLDIFWLISRGPVFFFFPERSVIGITTEFGDKKEALHSLSHNIFSK